MIDLPDTRPLILDGALGTQMQQMGLGAGDCPELWALDHLNKVLDISRAYIEAGSDVVYTPTFGANAVKLEFYGAAQAVSRINYQLAQAYKSHFPGVPVFGDIGPTGRFVEPFGDLDFETAVSLFKEQIQALIQGGADGVAIETMMDLQEARAALIAAREVTDKPVWVTMTFELGGRTLMGTDICSMAYTLQGLGADALGLNCSAGPDEMLDLVQALAQCARVPIIAKPNAGMPRLQDGRTVYDMQPEAFGGACALLVRAGARMVGGCCGTAPAHIYALRGAVQDIVTPALPAQPVNALCSARETVYYGPGLPLAVIGERINPTGKKKLQQALKDRDSDAILDIAARQKAHGALLLDVNAGMPGIDEVDTLRYLTLLLSGHTNSPLCLDSASPEALAAALRVYPGRALINSVSAEASKIDAVLSLAKKYGAACIALPIGDEGIPRDAGQRMQLIDRIVQKADTYGIPAEHLVVDALAMTVSSDHAAPGVALSLIRACTERGLNTVLGVSNVSFGLPQRAYANAAFLNLAMAQGLTMAIANPEDDRMRYAAASGDALLGRDPGLKRYIACLGEASAVPEPSEAALSLRECIVQGRKRRIPSAVEEALTMHHGDAQKVMEQCVFSALQDVGALYESGKYYLPQLIESAEAAKEAFAILEKHMERASGAAPQKKVVVLATVKGDVHDIGKNIVGLMLKNEGYQVVDLGKDVPREQIVEAAREHGAALIGLSALITSTMIEMPRVIGALQDARLNCPVIVGGAVVTPDFAQGIGAQGYAKDAIEAVQVANRLTEKQ